MNPIFISVNCTVVSFTAYVGLVVFKEGAI